MAKVSEEDISLSCALFRSRKADQVFEAGGRHFILEVEDGEDIVTAYPAVGGDKAGIKAHVRQREEVNGAHSILKQTCQNGMVGIDLPKNGAFHFLPQRVSSPVVVLVLALLAAEFAVGPAIQDFLTTLQATGLNLEIFERIGHKPVFRKGEKPLRQMQAS